MNLNNQCLNIQFINLIHTGASEKQAPQNCKCSFFIKIVKFVFEEILSGRVFERSQNEIVININK